METGNQTSKKLIGRMKQKKKDLQVKQESFLRKGLCRRRKRKNKMNFFCKEFWFVFVQCSSSFSEHSVITEWWYAKTYDNFLAKRFTLFSMTDSFLVRINHLCLLWHERRQPGHSYRKVHRSYKQMSMHLPPQCNFFPRPSINKFIWFIMLP